MVAGEAMTGDLRIDTTAVEIAPRFMAAEALFLVALCMAVPFLWPLLPWRIRLLNLTLEAAAHPRQSLMGGVLPVAEDEWTLLPGHVTYIEQPNSNRFVVSAPPPHEGPRAWAPASLAAASSTSPAGA